MYLFYNWSQNIYYMMFFRGAFFKSSLLIGRKSQQINIMLAQVLINIFFFLLKIVVWVGIAFAAIPLGILMLFLSIFPEFTNDGGFWFWVVFIPLNVVAYYFLWKPIVWIVTTITALCEGIQRKYLVDIQMKAVLIYQRLRNWAEIFLKVLLRNIVQIYNKIEWDLTISETSLKYSQIIPIAKLSSSKYLRIDCLASRSSPGISVYYNFPQAAAPFVGYIFFVIYSGHELFFAPVFKQCVNH